MRVEPPCSVKTGHTYAINFYLLISSQDREARAQPRRDRTYTTQSEARWRDMRPGFIYRFRHRNVVLNNAAQACTVQSGSRVTIPAATIQWFRLSEVSVRVHKRSAPGSLQCQKSFIACSSKQDSEQSGKP